MKVNQSENEQAQQLNDWYGNGSDGSCPTMTQWQNILSQPTEGSITLVNFFKFRTKALYPQDHIDHNSVISGNDAFDRYAAVSIPTMERIGGNFLYVGPFVGTLMGGEEDWDIVAMGRYPDLTSFLNLYSDADYRKAFIHRSAACERQKVLHLS